MAESEIMRLKTCSKAVAMILVSLRVTGTRGGRLWLEDLSHWEGVLICVRNGGLTGFSHNQNMVKAFHVLFFISFIRPSYKIANLSLTPFLIILPIRPSLYPTKLIIVYFCTLNYVW